MRKIQLASILLLACFVCNAATMRVNKTFTNDTVLNLLNSQPLITSLAISGSVNFSSDIGLVRVILKNKSGAEYIVYESYPFCSPSKSFQFSGEAEETSILPDSKADGLYLIIRDASLTISNLEYTNTTTGKSSQEIKAAQASATKIKAQQKISRINANMQLYNGEWTAGLGNFAALPFEDRKAFFGGTREYTIHGYEFYIGGIYSRARSSVTVMKSSSNSDLGADGFIKEFDWRKVHNAHLPTSPYFDGSPYRDGWATSVKNQLWNMPYRCGSCWAFGAIGTIEIYANLYYNKHIDLNLSEQEIISCSKGNCSGGYSETAYEYIKNNLVFLESCFPYVGYEQPCKKICLINDTRIGITSHIGWSLADRYWEIPYSSTIITNLKRALLEFGPIDGSHPDHSMVCVGWTTNSFGETSWIFKDSHGYNHGENGYNIQVHDNQSWKEIIQGPIVGLDQIVQCLDFDGDGYYNWGIGPKPSSCHPCAPDTKDHNDDDASLAGRNMETGELLPVIPIVLNTTVVNPSIQSFTIWSDEQYPCDNISVSRPISSSNGHIALRGLIVQGIVYLLGNAQMTVSNSTLKVIGGKIDNANIRFIDQGHFLLADKAEIVLGRGDSFTINVGSTGAFLESKFLIH
jgi:hypothetical protein